MAGCTNTEATHLHLVNRCGTRGADIDLQADITSRLDDIEASLFKVLLGAAELSKSGTVVRVAGGWVRDKLLGLKNEDIDIALDNCTGVAFADLVNAHLTHSGQEQGKVAVIEANPEQSKHLETARMKVLGVWVDLVNLRTETYRSDSRIPEAAFGTAEEDALRRDFTINALFFNVNTWSVEDMTKRGVEDLRDGIIRTPLPPMMTFEDDPLRVLRAVRFASRFGFTLHEDLRRAAQDSKIQAALESKVSRERVGAEVSGMLTGKMAQPALALSLLEELGLAGAVFCVPRHVEPAAPDGGFDWSRGASVARAAARLLQSRELSKASDGSGNEGGAGHETRVGEGQVGCAGSPVPTGSTGAGAGVKESPDGGEGAAGAAAAATGSQGLGGGSGDAGGKEGSGEGSSQAGPAAGAISGPVSTAKEEGKGGGKAGKGNGATAAGPDTLIRELFLSAALVPLSGVKHKVKKGKFVQAAQSVVQDSLKLKSKEAKNVGEIMEVFTTFRRLADIYEKSKTVGDHLEPTGQGPGHGDQDSCGEPTRLEVGLAVRQAKELWKTCVDLCCAQEMSGLGRPSGVAAEPMGADAATGPEEQLKGSARPGHKRARVDGESDKQGLAEDIEREREAKVVAKYAGFAGMVQRMGLERAWAIVPLVGGHDVMGVLGVAKGPEVGRVMARQVRWQLEHPRGTREQCLSFLRTGIGTQGT